MDSSHSHPVFGAPGASPMLWWETQRKLLVWNVSESNVRLEMAAHLQFSLAGVTAQQPDWRQGKHCHAGLKCHQVAIFLSGPRNLLHKAVWLTWTHFTCLYLQQKLWVEIEFQQVWLHFSPCTLIAISTNVFLVHKYTWNSSCKQILSAHYLCSVCFDCASSCICYLWWVNGHRTHILLVLVPDWVTVFFRQEY